MQTIKPGKYQYIQKEATFHISNTHDLLHLNLTQNTYCGIHLTGDESHHAQIKHLLELHKN
jgi:hypothetical protein